MRQTEPWLISRTADFWGAGAGSALLLGAMALVLAWHGDGELDTADLLLSELHLGATYDAIARRRLWRHMPVDVVLVPLAILAGTYALVFAGGPVVVTTAVLYLGAWHRSRQSLGIARHYQRHAGGPLSPWHRRLLTAAFYLPMVATLAFYTSTSSTHEGEEFLGLSLGPTTLWTLGVLGAISVGAYLAFVRGRTGMPPEGAAAPGGAARVHPGEPWLVVSHAAAFGSAYVVGTWSPAFMLILVIHHEVQYLYFTYAMARRSRSLDGLRPELRLLGSFSIWPVLGLASWAVCKGSELEWLEPFLTAGLLCHYWLDGRIWTARARRVVSAAPSAV
jgi:hypothetical protein